jgi:uncharacterized metal-binding protein YceD (DUF177 family)
MIINVSGIPEGRSVLSQVVKIEGEQARWLVCAQGLNCRAEIDRIPSRITVHLFYSGAVELECSRCLNHFNNPVVGDFHVVLTNRSAEKERELHPEDDVDFSFDDGTEEIDIGTAIFDEVITALPMKPVCRESCPGILDAPIETKMRQETSPGADGIDPRWDILKSIKKK